MKRLLTLLLMISFITTARSQSITAAEYFIDADPGKGNGTAITISTPADIVNFTANIPTASLGNGFHFAAMRVKDVNGIWGLFETRGFYISSAATNAANITAAEYFFDNDPGPGNGTTLSVGTAGGVVNFTAAVPTSLPAGFHFLAIRTKGADGIWGLFETRGFFISSTTANSANIVAAEYFFDTDPGLGNGTAASVGTAGAVVNFTASIPTSLPAGFHFLAIRTKGADGIWGLFETRGFYISSSTANAANIVAAEYFFDTDPGIGNGIAASVGTTGAIVNFTAVIPTSLPAGFHFLAIRTKGADGVWGLFETRGFYISSSTANAANIVAAEYFFDTDPGIGNGIAASVGTTGAIVNFTAVIPTSLPAGFHFLAIRTKGADGVWGLFETRGFYISSSTADAANIVAAEYFFDTDPGPGNGTPTAVGTSGAVVNFTATIPAALSTGFHFLSIRVKGQDGIWGLFEKRGFYISTTTVNTPIITAAEYFYDNDPGVGNGTPLAITSPGNIVTQTFSIPAGTLPLGQHFLAIRVKDQAGNWGLYDFDTLNVGNSTINCPANATVSSGIGQCNAVVNNVDPVINPVQSFTYTLSGATTGTGSGTASGHSFNIGITTVAYALTGSPTVNCSFTVTVNAVPPSITTQPTSQAICTGSNVTFNVVATGSGLTYQWRKAGVNIGGATGTSFTITGAVAGDAGNYDVVISTPCATSVTSNTATLTVNTTPLITGQPANQTVCAGNNVTFSVVASGSGLTFQWRKGGINITGATNNSFTIIGATTADAGNYDVVINSVCGSGITSNTATLTVNTAPSITTQPTNQTVCAGTSVTFNVAATGTALTYQWRKGGVNITGAISSSFTITTPVPGDAGNYDVVVSGACPPAATSNTVSLTVNTAPAITVQPVGQAVCAGTNVTFTVTATGTALTYQWRKGGVNITGATNSSFSINNITTGNGGNYDVVVTGTCAPAVTSNTITLAVNIPPSITTQPTNQTICANGNVTFTVAATGTGITYQWRKAGVNINGATNSSFTINGAIAGDAGNYDVVVTGVCPPAATSNTVSLTVNTAPAITTQPLSQSVCAGNNVTFNVVATGSGLTYQWRKGGVNINGATNNSFTINGAVVGDAGNYDVFINGACTPPVTSATASLAINAITVINTQPLPQTICAGSNISFSVVATGTTITYQWRKGGTNIAGAISSSFTITGAATTDAGNYDVVVTGTCGTLTSSVAALAVSATGTWLGITNTDWNNVSNWCGAVPVSTTDVIIPSSAPNMPTLGGTSGTARNITINTGGSLTIGAGGVLDLFGSVTNNGTFNATAGAINFRGTNSQSMPAFTATNVTMNGTGGLVLTANTAITGTLTLTNGHITLGTNSLALGAGSTGSIASHIITDGSGVVIVKALAASNTRVVPVAVNASSYNPVMIVANAGHTTDDITVRVIQGVFLNGSSGTLFTDKSVDKTWLIDEAVAGGSNVNIILQWTASQELSRFDRNLCYVTQNIGGIWLSATATPATGTDPFTQTRTNVTAFSPFAVQTQPVPRPSTGIYPNPVATVLNVVTPLTFGDQVTISIYDMAGRIVLKQFVLLNTGLNQTAINVEKLSAGVYTIKATMTNGTVLVHTKFVKE
jgi:hypothetical protein